MVVSDLYAAGCPTGARLTQYPQWPSREEAHARIQGRSEITAEDVRAIAPFVLRHRLIVSGTTEDMVLRSAFNAVAPPAALPVTYQ